MRAGADRLIRWGVLGTGGAAHLFVRGLRHVTSSEPYAVASRSTSTAKEFAQRFGLPRSYSPYEEMLKDPNVDVVYIATPPVRHCEDSLACLGAGKAILCEKPFTTTSREAHQVVSLARDKGLFCMEAMWMRFLPAMDKAIRLCKSGAIGEVRMLLADFGVPTPRSSFRLDAQRGGGAVLDRAVYPLSLAFDLLGRPVEVSSRISVTPSGVDEAVGMLLRYEGGQVACLGASLAAYVSNEATIAGTSGRLRIHEPLCRPDRITLTALPRSRLHQDSRVGGWRLADTPLGTAFFGSLRRRLPPGLLRSQAIRVPFVGNGYNYEAQEVVACLQRGLVESPRMPLDETLAIMETLDSIRRLAVATSSIPNGDRPSDPI